MSELVMNYVGKKCIITITNGYSQVVGVIESVDDGWINVQSGLEVEIINMDYISRIKIVPLTKKEKKLLAEKELAGV